MLIAFATVVMAVILQIGLKIAERRTRPKSDDEAPTPQHVVITAIDGPAVLMLLIGGGTIAASIAVVQWQITQDTETDIALAVQRIGTVAMVAVGAYLTSRISS